MYTVLCCFVGVERLDRGQLSFNKGYKVNLECKSASMTQMSLEDLHTLQRQHFIPRHTCAHCRPSQCSHRKKNSIKACLLVFTLFIQGLSPPSTRLVFWSSGQSQSISFISGQEAVVMNFQYSTFIFYQYFMPNKIES